MQDKKNIMPFAGGFIELPCYAVAYKLCYRNRYMLTGWLIYDDLDSAKSAARRSLKTKGVKVEGFGDNVYAKQHVEWALIYERNNDYDTGPGKLILKIKDMTRKPCK